MARTRNRTKKNAAAPSKAVSVSLASARQFKQRAPANQFAGGGRRIQHRELMYALSGTTTWHRVGFFMNPALSESFRWLSSQARSWEQYRFNKLRIRYVPRCAATTAGSVIIVPDYDAHDHAPATEADACVYANAVETPPWAEVVCDLDPKAMFPMGPRKYTRYGIVPGDIKTHDAAVVWVGTHNMVDTSAVGKIWIEYDVELFVPQPDTSHAPTPQTISVFNRLSNQILANGVADVLKLDHELYNPLGIVYNSSTGSYSLPRGVYKVDLNAQTTDSAAERTSLSIGIYDLVTGVLSDAGESVTNAIANFGCDVVLSAIVGSDGTNSISVPIELGGAIGTLAAKKASQLMFRLVK